MKKRRFGADLVGNEDLMEEYPDLASEHTVACLDFARELSEIETAA